MLSCTLGANLLGNVLIDKGIIRAVEGTTRAGTGIIKAGEGRIRAGQDF